MMDSISSRVELDDMINNDDEDDVFTHLYHYELINTLSELLSKIQRMIVMCQNLEMSYYISLAHNKTLEQEIETFKI